MNQEKEMAVTELGLLQELEGIDRAIMDEEDARARDTRKHKKELDNLGKHRNRILEKLDSLRNGEMILFPDDETAAESDSEEGDDDGFDAFGDDAV